MIRQPCSVIQDSIFRPQHRNQLQFFCRESMNRHKLYNHKFTNNFLLQSLLMAKNISTCFTLHGCPIKRLYNSPNTELVDDILT